MKTIQKREMLSPRMRYRVMPGQVMPVAIQRPDEGQQSASGELLDITVSGARILSQVPLRFGEKFVLHLESESVVEERAPWEDSTSVSHLESTT